MKKSLLRSIVALGILLVLYHLIVFILPFEKNTVFWVSYVFTLAAFAVGAGTLFMVFGKNPDARSRFYGFPIARLGVIYAAVQIIAGIAFMAVGKWVFWWIALLVYAILLGAALLGLIAAESTLEEIKAQDGKLKKNVSMMRSLRSKVSQLASQYDHPQLKKLAEEIRYSDPVSSDALAEVEADLSDLINQLQMAVVQGDSNGTTILCKKATATLNERNRLCKLNKS